MARAAQCIPASRNAHAVPLGLAREVRVASLHSFLSAQRLVGLRTWQVFMGFQPRELASGSSVHPCSPWPEVPLARQVLLVQTERVNAAALYVCSAFGAFARQSVRPSRAVPNPSIERTAHSQLRCLRSAAHVER
jgi:hypothetical protein